jgi:hypothetical protein
VNRQTSQRPHLRLLADPPALRPTRVQAGVNGLAVMGLIVLAVVLDVALVVYAAVVSLRDRRLIRFAASAEKKKGMGGP